MEEEKLKKVLYLAIKASLCAGDEIMKVYRSDFAVEHKEDHSPLTLADQNANKVITDILSETEIPVLSEEGRTIAYSERKAWEYLWVVDPLDGTKEFVKRNGEFTVNIALVKNQRPILGVIYQPVTQILYYALENTGSFKISSIENAVPETDELIRQSQRLPLKNLQRKFTVMASRSHRSNETLQYINELQKTHREVEWMAAGSSLKFCIVAEGSADVYPRFAPTREWDTAAGQAILEQAGGSVKNYPAGGPMLYNKADLLNSWFIAKGKEKIS